MIADVSALLVRNGGDAKIPRVVDPRTGDVRHPGHKMLAVYGEMVLQIYRDYACLPDANTLSMREIRFFYDGLRPELKHCTK